MFIQNNSTSKNIPQPTFGAFKVATARNYVKGMETSIDIYQLGKKDSDFIKLIDEDTDYHELGVGLRKEMQDRWQKVFHYCIEKMKCCENQSFVAVCGNKPCGIITFLTAPSSAYLDAICKIPTIGDNEVHLVGKSMLLHFFKTAENLRSKTLSLDAVKDGPVDVISFYEKFGFKKIFGVNDDGAYQPMEMNGFKLKEQMKKLENLIKYKEEKTPQEVNLMDLIS